LLGRVRVPSVPRRLRSYWALRRLTFFGRRCGLPRCAAHLRLGASSEPAAGAPSTYGASEILVRLPVGLDYPRKGETLPGHWVVLLGRAAVSDPAERATTSPMPVAALLPSGHLIPWAFGKTVSRLYSRGPRPRAPTHHPGTSLPPEQGSLPACRVGLWPGRLRTCWTTTRNFMNYRMVSILSDQPSLVAPSAGRCRGQHCARRADLSTLEWIASGPPLRLTAVRISSPTPNPPHPHHREPLYCRAHRHAGASELPVVASRRPALAQ